MKKLTHTISLLAAFVLALCLCLSPAFSERQKLFTPGTYEGSSEGFHGPVSLKVTVSEDAITDIQATHTETTGIGDQGILKLIEGFKASPSLNVDVVAGATFSSKGFLAAMEQALTAAGADIAALKAMPREEVVKTDREISAEVLIIGGGGAGLSAGVTAHQNGAKVLLVEKMPKLGGNTILSGAAYNAADPARQAALTMTELEKKTVEDIIAGEQTDPMVQGWQKTLKSEWEAYKASGETFMFDSPSLHKLQTYNGGDKLGEPALIDTLCENAYPTIRWAEELGMGFEGYIFTVLGGLWNRAHQPTLPLGTGWIKTYEDYFKAHADEMEIMLNTKATHLIVEEGRVVGALCEGETENLTIRASKGVVIATGGFGNNVEMRDKYNTKWPSLTNLKSTNSSSATGDGIVMAEEIGAQLVGMEEIQLLPMGDPHTGSLSGNIEQSVQDRIFVNKEGKRFVDEGARRDVMTKALMEQTDSTMWVVLDKHSYPTGDVRNHFNESIDELVAAGRAYKADTLEDLAKQIGVDAGNLVAAVTAFNASVDGAPDPFGRTLFAQKIDTAPFYAGVRVPTVHHTMGGIKIDGDAHVIGKDDKPIPGLYAAGEVTGGIHGTNRLGGNALADISVFGQIAGKNAALEQ
jgi:urocanate reductase